MGTAERRKLIMKELCKRKHDTINNLAVEFGVSIRTIQRDIDVLSLTEPIYSQAGRYNGGVYVLDEYTLNRIQMSDVEKFVLNKIYAMICEKCENQLTKDEFHVFQCMINNYSKPPKGKEGK